VSSLPEQLTIGQVAERSGVPHTALRFYEESGLITATRTAGNQRRYPRAVLRRLAFIRTAQRVGLSLDQIREALSTLPNGRPPTKSDWSRLSRSWRAELDTRIDALQRLRDRLTSCIGCGCLSLRSCALHNPDDVAAALGPGSLKLRARSEGGID
jgi:MerR family transcriptional regulator, redox-sensitive transcriptional activator SoxR